MSDMSRDETLSDPGLMRNIVPLGGAGIASSSKSIPDAQSPCAPLYERWQRTGCEATSDAERCCLRTLATYEADKEDDNGGEH